MKIAVIAGHTPSLCGFRAPLLGAFRDAGAEVVALGPRDEPSEARLRGMGVGFLPIPLKRRGTNPLEDLRTLRALTAALRALAPDKIFNYTIKPIIWGSMAARRARVPECYSLITGLGHMFGEGGQGPYGWALQRLVLRLYRAGLADNHLVFFQNREDERFFRESGTLPAAVHSVVVPGSGVDLEAYAPAEPVLAPPVFLCLARCIREKGVFEFARAAARLKAVFPMARFLLAGALEPGPGGIPEREIRRWNKRGTVEYLGELADVRPAVAGASVFVLPSYYREGVPRSILEAMSMGRPVITTDWPGCRETVRHEVTGLLVPPRDVESLVRAMTTFIEDPQLVVSMGRASRELAERRFDVRTVNAMILEGMGLS